MDSDEFVVINIDSRMLWNAESSKVTQKENTCRKTPTKNEPADKSELCEELQVWAERNNCSTKALSELSYILSKSGVHGNLPLHWSGSSQQPSVKTLSRGGELAYFGLEAGLRRTCDGCERIELLVNITFTQISEYQQLWTILAKDLHVQQPFLVTAYFGQVAPCVGELLDDLLEELSRLQGVVQIGQQGVPVSLKAFVCDVQIRSFIKQTTKPGEFNSCERCMIEGRHFAGRVMFEETFCQPRTDKEFKRYVYASHPKGSVNDGSKPHQAEKTILVDHGVLCVTKMSLDYYNCVCLGVMKQLFSFWIEGPAACRLTMMQKEDLSHRLSFYADKLPREFSSRPRSLNEVRQNAEHLRQFMFYTGPVVLRGILNKDRYRNFLSLHLAMNILCSSHDRKRAEDLTFAKTLLVGFSQNLSKLYGFTFPTYDAHVLTHLYEDVENHNCSLHQLSSFPFQTYLTKLQKFVVQNKKSLTAISQWVLEGEQTGNQTNKNSPPHVYPDDRDGWFLTTSGTVIVNIRQQVHEDIFECHCYDRHQTDDFFTWPNFSSNYGVYTLNNDVAFQRRTIRSQDLETKLVCMKRNKDRVLVEVDPQTIV